MINEKVFDENRIDVTVKLGDTEEWTILNRDSQYHDFHIHQTGFLVTEVNGVPAHSDGLRDTFSVPPTDGEKPGAAKLIVPFTNPEIVGRFVFHCHVSKHEDKGMMQTIELRRWCPGAWFCRLVVQFPKCFGSKKRDHAITPSRCHQCTLMPVSFCS